MNVPNKDYTVLTLDQFLVWLDKLQVKRKITWMAWHHTASPNTADVQKKGFAYYVKAVQRVHMIDRGWQDSAQHLAINNADGKIILCRDMELDGGGIKNDPKGDITTEIFGNFDTEQMTDACKKTVLAIASACSKKFSIPLDETGHKYHNWFDLNTGKELKDGEPGVRKTCPGKNFFGGFTRKAFRDTFVHALLAYNKKQRIDETVVLLGQKKRKDGVKPLSDSPESWRGVFNGAVPPNMDNILTLLRRAMGVE